ncbi:MAG TPA: Ig-like domain-containing protein, partial [Accumulibacter sp.]|uniref:tandem-95 repeat protein n=1 Tax=Accumulibacter sp. TaxID=2053492 RepID=UPI002C2543D5
NPVNDVPLAVGDAYTVDEDGSLTVAANGVLGNDVDVDGDSLSAVLVSDVAHGVLTLNADGGFSYVPEANYHGSDSFSYRANDGSSDSNVVTVSLTINPVNDVPLAVGDAYTVDEDGSLTVAANGVLGNDSDLDGDSLSAVLVSDVAHGVLTLNADGGFSYAPSANYHGSDSFSYKANDGSDDSNVVTVELTVLPVTLRVTSFAPTDSGFRVEFNRAVEAHVLNLYGPGSSGDNDRPLAKGPADVTLQGSGSIGGVRGSLVLDDDRMGATFVRTNGVLAAGDYTLTLASRSDGWQDTSGHLLDGDGDGQGGGDYVQHFTVAGSSSAVLSAGEMMIGPGLALGIPGGAGVGLPITLSNAAGVTAVEFKLAYEPALLEISGVSLAAGVTGTVDWTSVPGVLSVSLTTSGLGAASSELLRILGTVPESARQYYGAKHVLDLFDVRLSAGGVAQSVRVDDGLHVNAYVADTNGSASYTTLDQQRLQRVISAYDSGFSAYPLVDPIVVADVNNSRNLTSADTLLLAREINWLTTGTASNNRPEIPDIPSGIGPFDFTGADPVVDIPRNLTAVAGGVVTVPVRLDTAAGLEAVQVQLAWNPELLELVGIRRGSLTGDFQYFVARQQAGELLVDMSRLEQMAGGQGSVLELEFRVAASAAGLVEVDLQWARLNDTHLTLNPAPLFGADPTDGAVFVANTGARPAEFSAFAAPDLSSGQSAAAQLSAVANSVVIDLAARYEGFAFARNGEGDRRWLAESLVDGSSASERREARAGKPMGKLAFLDKAVPVKSGVQLRR